MSAESGRLLRILIDVLEEAQDRAVLNEPDRVLNETKCRLSMAVVEAECEEPDVPR